MKITIEPTPEMFHAPINGTHIPTRVWVGKTEGGVSIDAYVLSIVPDSAEACEAMRAELPVFMRPSRETFTIDTSLEAAVIDPAAVAELQKDNDRLRTALNLATHKVICCGVAAKHKNPELSKSPPYSTAWDSPQAQSVRELRADRDALPAAVREAIAQRVAKSLICSNAEDVAEFIRQIPLDKLRGE